MTSSKKRPQSGNFKLPQNSHDSEEAAPLAGLHASEIPGIMWHRSKENPRPRDMAEPHVISALRKKRAELAGEVVTAQLRFGKLRDDLDAIDRTAGRGGDAAVAGQGGGG
jgi:hypothetical protein